AWRTIQLQAAVRRLAGSGAGRREEGAAWAAALRERTRTRRAVLRRTARFMRGLSFRRPAAAVSLIAVEPPPRKSGTAGEQEVLGLEQWLLGLCGSRQPY